MFISNEIVIIIYVCSFFNLLKKITIFKNKIFDILFDIYILFILKTILINSASLKPTKRAFQGQTALEDMFSLAYSSQISWAPEKPSTPYNQIDTNG